MSKENLRTKIKASMQQRASLVQFFSSPRASTLSTNALMEEKSKTTPRRGRPKLKSIGNSSGSGGNLQQMIIDAGQKNIGMEHCIKCGMVYSKENPKDIKQHEQFHNRFNEVRNFRVTRNQIDSWKSLLKYEQVSAPVGGMVFILSSSSTATLKRKLEEILKNTVNEELGYSSDLPVWETGGQRKAFVFIVDSQGSNPPFVAGILLIDPVDEVLVMPINKHFKGSFFGVDRLWVHSHLRRNGIATFLLDKARQVLSPDTEEMLSRRRIAFSDPTELGVKFAIQYANEEDKTHQRQQFYIVYSPAIPPRDRVDELVKKMESGSSG